MHQPYYKNLLTHESEMPWVRLHGVKDYLDMVRMLNKFPEVKLTFNLVPSLLEQIEDFTNQTVKDKFLELSYKQANDLEQSEKEFLLNNFFSINEQKVIATIPRYYDLYLKHKAKKSFTTHDFLDLQVLFNLAWIDPSFRESIPELRHLVQKARFFTEPDKHIVLDKQLEILKQIIPEYRKFIDSGQIEATVTPYYHPILPLLYNTKIAREANTKSPLPKTQFNHPEDVKAQIDLAVEYFNAKFGIKPYGMWPSEESVSEHILPFIIQSGIKWIVADEAILFKSLSKKKRDTTLLYQPHLLRRKEGDLNIVFRDRNLSDLIGFVYHTWKAQDAATDLMKHLGNISIEFKGKDTLVTIAMDGENAWEYYSNDGIDFLEALYGRLSESKIIKTTTIKDYLHKFRVTKQIKRLAAGSWIYGEFGKWIGNPYKVRAWEALIEARKALETARVFASPLAWKQMYILEGSDWFWWAGEDVNGAFDKLYRMHLTNLYTILDLDPPDYLKKPLHPV